MKYAVLVETRRGERLTFPDYTEGEQITAMRIALGTSRSNPAADVWLLGPRGSLAERLARYVDGRVARATPEAWHVQGYVLPPPRPSWDDDDPGYDDYEPGDDERW